jgi:hypothetical protein
MKQDSIHVQDHLSGSARVPNRKFTSFFSYFAYSVKFNHRVYGFGDSPHGPFKVIVEESDGKFLMLADRLTEDALRILVWR